MIRVLIAGFKHETNTFSAMPTDLEAYQARALFYGDDVAENLRGTRTEIAAFLGGNPEFEVLTMRLADIVGSRGNDWHLLTAGAFVTMILPLVVFFALQRYFVRGLMAGSVKG